MYAQARNKSQQPKNETFVTRQHSENGICTASAKLKLLILVFFRFSAWTCFSLFFPHSALWIQVWWQCNDFELCVDIHGIISKWLCLPQARAEATIYEGTQHSCQGTFESWNIWNDCLVFGCVRSIRADETWFGLRKQWNPRLLEITIKQWIYTYECSKCYINEENTVHTDTSSLSSYTLRSDWDLRCATG